MKNLLLFFLLLQSNFIVGQIDILITQAIQKANDLSEKGDDSKALELTKTFADKTPLDNASCNNKGNLFNRMGVYAYMIDNYKEAISYWEKALVIRENCKETQITDLATTHGNLVAIYEQLEHEKKRIFHLKESIALLEQIQSIDTLELAYRYVQMGSYYTSKGDFSLSKE